MTLSTQDAAVLAADEARYQALYAQDIDALDAMLVENYVHTHANGKIDDKATFLFSIQAAKYRFVLAERSDQRVRWFGSMALLSGLTTTTILMGEETRQLNNAFVTVWLAESDRLRMVHWQATKVAVA